METDIYIKKLGGLVYSNKSKWIVVHILYALAHTEVS